MTGSGTFERWDFPGTVLAIAFVIGLMVASTSAPAQEPAPAPPVPKAPDQGPLIAPPDGACLKWSDGCRTCSFDPKLVLGVCSNIGIACQPHEVTCTERRPDAEKK